MIGHIMKHEFRLLLRERLLVFIVPVYVLLIAYGLANGAGWRSFLTANTAAASQSATTALAKLPTKLAEIQAGAPYAAREDPRNPGKIARSVGFEMATKPPAATAAVAIGQSDVHPSYLQVQWKAMFNQSNGDEVENPVNLSVGRFDLSFVMIYLYPLLIIALSYNILSSEREGGTQALMLSQPVSVQQFVLGKVLLRGIVIVGLGVLMSLMGLIVASPGILLGGGFVRLVLLSAVLVAYGAFWFGLSVIVNAFPNKSSTNALILIGSWLAFVLLIPAALNLVAKNAFPLPSRIELVQSTRRGDAVAQKEAERAGVGDKNNADLAARGGEEATMGSMNEFYKRVMPIDKRGETVAAPIFDRFERQKQRQQSLASGLNFLSPAILVQDAMSEIAETSTESYRHFDAQVAEFHQKWRDYFYPSVLAERLLTMQQLKDIPRFRYVPEANATIVTRVLASLLGLCCLAATVGVLGFALLKRYPVAAR